jgi:hypothetical protein
MHYHYREMSGSQNAPGDGSHYQLCYATTAVCSDYDQIRQLFTRAGNDFFGWSAHFAHRLNFCYLADAFIPHGLQTSLGKLLGAGNDKAEAASLRPWVRLQGTGIDHVNDGESSSKCLGIVDSQSESGFGILREIRREKDVFGWHDTNLLARECSQGSPALWLGSCNIRARRLVEFRAGDSETGRIDHGLWPAQWTRKDDAIVKIPDRV